MSRKKSYKQLRKQQQDRSRIYFIIGGVVLVAVFVVLILISQNRGQASGTAYQGDIVTVENKDYPQVNGSTMGPADAPVVVRVFSDFQCPFCGEFARTVEPQLIQDYVATGKVRLEYHHFIIIDRNVGGTESQDAAEASECAAEQGKFWNYHDILFANQHGEGQGSFNKDRLKSFAESIGLNMNQFNSCFSSHKFKSKIATDQALGTTLGVQGTPTVYIDGQRVANPMDYNALKSAIEAQLNKGS